MKDIIIRVNNIRKTYRVSKRKKDLFGNIANIFVPKYENVCAVQNIDFEIMKGAAVGFIGPNGAGKSTVIKMLSGVLYPDSGEINCMGYVPYKQREKYVSKIGAVFGQKSQLIWELPLIDSFELLKKIYRVDEKTYQNNLKQFRKILGLDMFINQPVRQLSLGQRMRGEITAALLHSPELVFLDEPTIGLDVLAKDNVREFIRYINKEMGTTILFTSHDMRDIELICNRLILIDKGKIIYDGNKENLIDNYSAQKKISIEFSEIYENVYFEGLRIVNNDKYKKEIFVSDFNEATSIISQITQSYKVRDISIQDVDVEQVIKQIYKKRINQGVSI